MIMLDDDEGIYAGASGLNVINPYSMLLSHLYSSFQNNNTKFLVLMKYYCLLAIIVIRLCHYCIMTSTYCL